MAQYSFDIQSQYDLSEMNNLYMDVNRQIQNRYDFKNSSASLEWLDNKTGFKLTGDNDFQINSIEDLIRKKLALRNLNQNIIDFSQPLKTSNFKITKDLKLKQSLAKEEISSLTKFIRNNFTKIKIVNQTDSLKITSNSKNELQDIIKLSKQEFKNLPLEFTNFK
jgi:hypothetical protein